MSACDYSLVADIYDGYVKTDLDVAFFREESKKAKGRVLELMCGTGRLTLALLADGVPMTCVDSSPEMLVRLRQKLAYSGYQAEVFEQDVTCLSLPGKYDLAIIPFNSYMEITTRVGQGAALRSIHRHLLPGGRLIVTLHNPNVRLRRVDGLIHTIGRFPLDDGGATFTLSVTEAYDAASALVTGIQVFEAVDSRGRALWRRDVPIMFRLVARQEFEDLAASAGLRVDAVFGDYDRSAYDAEASPYIITHLQVC